MDIKLLKFFILLLPLSALAQHTLTVKVTGLQSSEGLIGLGLYNSEATWLEDGKTFKGDFAKITGAETVIVLSDIPDGSYALSLYHDKNGDKKLDKNMFGIPKEPLGFSIGKLKTFGPPNFEECSFILNRDFEIKIPMK